jgi:hypothetical protein
LLGLAQAQRKEIQALQQEVAAARANLTSEQRAMQQIYDTARHTRQLSAYSTSA